MKNKRMMSAAIAVLMAGSLAACGGNSDSTTAAALLTAPLLPPHLYRSAFTNFHMGYSCALAWILVVIIGLAIAILFKTQNAWVHYEAE